MLEKAKHSVPIQIGIGIVLQILVIAAVLIIYSGKEHDRQVQEEAAVVKVNKVCDNHGGIDDADEAEKSWEVRCKLDDKTFIIYKYEDN